MQPTPRKINIKSKTEHKKEEIPSSSKKEEKNKPISSTPRNFIQKSSTADIYGQKKQSSIHVTKTPKKVHGTSNLTSDVSPMKDFLKSSPSSVSVGQKSARKDVKVSSRHSARDVRTAKDLLFVNVTVNSPIAKRRLLKEDINVNKNKDSPITERKNIARENSSLKTRERNVVVKKETEKTGENFKERQRTKTRTLDENEVKILTIDNVNNNREMMNLAQKLKAKPKAFFIELEDDTTKAKSEKSSEEDISYEDDFESYESDFESYHSETNDDEVMNQGDEEIDGTNVEESNVKEIKDDKDEERMLDSGSYDLRDRSAKSKPAIMDFIIEDSEDMGDQKVSLTDEGFQEMSSSSAVSSLRTVQVDVLDRPLFVDFTKSKANKRKRLINERFKQRAKDLLSMISLHEMTFTLFEMKPITYDVYMATFGRNNYMQTATQTFGDGSNVEIQTDLVEFRHIWTQHPVEFSQSDIWLQKVDHSRKYSQNTEVYLKQFTFLTENIISDMVVCDNTSDLNYESNALRIYFEQKHGVGTTEMLPYEIYKNKLKNVEYNSDRLRNFLKKCEGRISNILSFNAGNIELSGLKTSKLSCSKGYLSISTKMIENERYLFLMKSKINKIILSQSKNSLILTVCNKSDSSKKCIVCLWDVSVARKEPIKILVAIDNVNVGAFRGNSEGIFVAALDDGSLHLWDLSEKAIWRDDNIVSEEKTRNTVEVKAEKLTEMERDREWNLKNSDIGSVEVIPCALQSCAYTNSAYNLMHGDQTDVIVGLELSGDTKTANGQDGGRKIVGQVTTLQRIGILMTWNIVQEKSKKSSDQGKAYWSKLKLEKLQNVNLTDHIDALLENNVDNFLNFNLSSAKRRLLKRKHERSILNCPKSAVSFKSDSDRPSNAASVKNKHMLPVHNNLPFWDNIVLCNDVKIVVISNVSNYLIAKNNGEVLCSRRIAGVFKVEKLTVSSDTSTITHIEVSPHDLPYFLASTDSGTVNLCSLLEKRVLLTLDCRNITPHETSKCLSDHKGRFISSIQTAETTPRGREFGVASRISISSLQWSHVNPCCFYALLTDGALIAWDLTQSDIYARCVSDTIKGCVASDNNLALLTLDGEVQIHRLANEQRTNDYVELFKKYVALL